MTKADMVERVYEHFYRRDSRFSKKESQDVVDLAFEIIKNAIVDDGKLKIAGFGVFEVRQKNNRRGRNPQTGEDITITPRKVLSFKASVLLKKRVAG